MRLISDELIYPRRAFRIDAFLMAMGRKSARSREIHFSTDLLEGVHSEWFRSNDHSGLHSCMGGAVLIGFSLLRVISEIRNLRNCDVPFPREGSAQHLEAPLQHQRTTRAGARNISYVT